MQSDSLHSGSISFGRFETEALSWERRSSFSHNRYLEEVEKYSRPGSVTEKKAYFEAHFKRKALLSQSSSECQDGIERQNSENESSENLGSQEEFEHLNEDRHMNGCDASPAHSVTNRGFENMMSYDENRILELAEADCENIENYDASPAHSMTNRGFENISTYGERQLHSVRDGGFQNMMSWDESPVHPIGYRKFDIIECENDDDAGASYPKPQTGAAAGDANNLCGISEVTLTDESFQAEAEDSTLSSTGAELKAHQDHNSDCDKTNSEISSKTTNMSLGSPSYQKDDSVTSTCQRYPSPKVCLHVHLYRMI